MDNDYAKDRERQISYPKALELAKQGWVIAREGWNGKGMIVFMAREGNFTAQDLTSGRLEPFLVMRTTQGTYVPWLCSQSDALSEDWVAISRQTFQRQIPDSHQRDTKRVAQEEPIQGVQRPASYTSGDYRVDGSLDSDRD